MCAAPKESEGISPGELQVLLDRLDSLVIKLGDLPCLPPASDRAFRKPEDFHGDAENLKSFVECCERICESLKRRGSFRSLT